MYLKSPDHFKKIINFFNSPFWYCLKWWSLWMKWSSVCLDCQEWGECSRAEESGGDVVYPCGRYDNEEETLKCKHCGLTGVPYTRTLFSRAGACECSMNFVNRDGKFRWALANTSSAGQASTFTDKESTWSSYSIVNPFWLFCACSKSSRWWRAFCVSATNSSSWPTGLIFWPPVCPTWSPGTPKPPEWRSTRSTDCYGEFSLKLFYQS